MTSSSSKNLLFPLLEIEIFESKNNFKAGKIYLGLYLSIGDKKTLTTSCQNRDQIGPLLSNFPGKVPIRDLTYK